MKIFFISHWGWGLYKSRSQIAKEIRKTYTVSAVCPKDEYYDMLIDSYDNFYEWNIDRTKSNLRQILSTLNLNKILREHLDDNLFHVFTFKSSVLFSLSLTLLRKKKSIHAISSITGLGYFFGNAVIARIARTIFRLPLIAVLSGTYDYYIFQNQTDLNRLKNYLKLDPGILKLIESSGLDTKEIEIKNKFSTKNLKVIMATRLLKEKGIDEYIEIAKKVKEHNKKIDFFLAGDIDKGNPSSIDEEQLVKIINDDDIIYLGNVDDLQNKLLEYDIAVTTSHHEGFSRFLLESSYVGLYCLSNYLPGTKAILKNNLNGKL
ncbi:uncharacterized protein METZ01_LOCUS318520, partial [marine metagenome]